jgi:hypothetical protein
MPSADDAVSWGAETDCAGAGLDSGQRRLANASVRRMDAFIVRSRIQHRR